MLNKCIIYVVDLMSETIAKVIEGYQKFREKYVDGNSMMQQLAEHGQSPKILVVACCDSRVDPALLLQSDPGDLFIVRNVANIIPPCENDEAHHGTSAALEFGVRHLEAEHLIILGHSSCGGIKALLNKGALVNDDFISNWVDLIKVNIEDTDDPDVCAELSLLHSYENALSFPWIKQRVEQNLLSIHLWFFDIQHGAINYYCHADAKFKPLIEPDG